MMAEASATPLLSAKSLALSLSRDGTVSEDMVSVLVNRINRKAASVSGRRLIIGESHHGFRINPYL